MQNRNRNLQTSKAPSKAKRRAPAYSRALHLVKRVIRESIVRRRSESGFRRIRGVRVAAKVSGGSRLLQQGVRGGPGKQMEGQSIFVKSENGDKRPVLKLHELFNQQPQVKTQMET